MTKAKVSEVKQPVEVVEEVEVVEVGKPGGFVEDDREAYKAALAEAAKRAPKVPVVTQPEVRTSFDEQQDPEFHKQLAKDSLRVQKALDKERQTQNDNYLAGR